MAEHIVDAELQSEIDSALELMHAGLDRLIATGDRGDLGALGPNALVALIRRFESLRNRLCVVDHAIVEAVECEQLWQTTSTSNAAGAIREIARVSLPEAKARVRAAEALGPRVALTGEELPPLLASTAAAQRRGELSARHAAVIGRCTAGLRGVGLAETAVADAETALLQHAAAFDPVRLEKIAAKVIDVLLPDGRPPRDELVRARRGIVLGSERPDGSCSISGSLTKSLRAKLFAVTSPLATPRPENDSGLDSRTAPQRLHDAFEDLCDRMLRSGSLPTSAGMRATVMVVGNLDDLLAEVEGAGIPVPGSGRSARKGPAFTTADGRVISVDELLHIAAAAEIIPTWMTDSSGVISHGRQRRCASPSQMRALVARDGGCSFPGCDIPPQWCEAHHVIPWLDGGPTDVDNLTLLCGHHHRVFAARSWECRMVGGRPYWRPPRWVDPDRRSIQNTARAAVPLQSPQADRLVYDMRAAFARAVLPAETLGRITTAVAALDARMAREVNEIERGWIEQGLDRLLADGSDQPLALSGVLSVDRIWQAPSRAEPRPNR